MTPKVSKPAIQKQTEPFKIKTLQKSEILRLERMKAAPQGEKYKFKFSIKEADYKPIKGISLKKRVNFKKRDHLSLIEGDSEKTVEDSRVDCQYCGRLFWAPQHIRH